jgi:hypothetical protein
MKRQIKYFLEHKTKRKWLTDKEHCFVLTTDPEKAMSFNKIESAKLYLAVNQRSGTLLDFDITEHEFVPSVNDDNLKQRLRKAEKMLYETSAIFRGWFASCSEQEIKQSFSEWRKLEQRINKFLDKK